MAVHKKNSHDIPSDAVILTQDEALTYNWKIIESWETSSEVWALRYGPGILGAMCSVTSIFIHRYYRRKLKLGRFGNISTYLPIVALPAIMSTVYHKGFIQYNLILGNDECPVCLTMRAGLYQSLFGVGYATLLSPLASFMYASRHYTYRLPSVTKEPKEVLKLWWKLTRPLTFRLTCLFALHAFVAGFITFKEMENYFTMRGKLLELQENLQNTEESSKE